MNNKSVYTNSSMNTVIAIFVLSAIMIGLSILLTNHYYAVKFPTGFEAASVCNINSFFNCDSTTLSPASNILGAPISIFGIVIGALVMIGLFFKNAKYEKTMYFTLILNMIGCIGLFIYSLLALGTLCPFCTLYYITSGLTLWLFYRNSTELVPDPLFLTGFAILLLIAGFAARRTIAEKTVDVPDTLKTSLITQYYALPNLGQPSPASEFFIAKAENAPVKIQIFSDFECPACKALSDMMPALVKKYAGKIEIQYYYYPLDHNCNPSMTRPLHEQACRGAYFATCMGPEKFGQVHDDIFHNQRSLASFLDDQIKKNNMEACVANPATREKVTALINASNPFNVASTPTLLLNGVKIEGVLPYEQLAIIIDEIIKRAETK